ncbi:MAG: acylphosphatase [Anaerolineales bacterium]|jgi:acylphosphatase
MDRKSNIRLHATIHGRVQGVSFRYFVLECANRLDLSGWVRNRYDGTVEVLAEGNQKQLDILIQDLHKGSSASNVTRVDHQWDDATGEFKSFRIRMTA